MSRRRVVVPAAPAPVAQPGRREEQQCGQQAGPEPVHHEQARAAGQGHVQSRVRGVWRDQGEAPDNEARRDRRGEVRCAPEVYDGATQRVREKRPASRRPAGARHGDHPDEARRHKEEEPDPEPRVRVLIALGVKPAARASAGVLTGSMASMGLGGSRVAPEVIIRGPTSSPERTRLRSEIPSRVGAAGLRTVVIPNPSWERVSSWVAISS